MEFSYEDCESLLEQANLQDKELMHKRRWLIGLPIPTSQNQNETETERPIPEYLLREDDVFFENIKSLVEKGCNTKNKYPIFQDDMQLVIPEKDVKAIFSLIHSMTNQGLLHFAEAITGGSIQFPKTRWKLKQIIKEYILKIKNKNSRKINLSEKQSFILKNLLNYRWSSETRFIPNSSHSYQLAVYKILDVLEHIPTQTLSAMHRKLKGGNKYSYTPKLIPKKTGWARHRLITVLRKKCLKLLSKLKKGDFLQEPLAKAMEVASLDFKLIKGYHYVTNFIRFSSQVDFLQNEIAISIHILDQNLDISIFKEIQTLLDPESKLSDTKLRTSIKNLLTEYLFECSDMDNIPQSLLEVVEIIRRSCQGPYKHLEETKIEEEVESILSVSACLKQVMLDLIPENELDREFADAYMEDLEDSDDDFDFFQVGKRIENNVNPDEEVASFGDNFNPVETCEQNSQLSSKKSRSLNFSEITNSLPIDGMRYHLVSLRNTEKSENADSTNNENVLTEKNPDLDDENKCENKYLDVQSASDEASMVAYRLIGLMLNDFAQTEECELNSAHMSYLGVSSSYLNPKKRKASRKEAAAAHNEDGCSINLETVPE